MKKKDVDEDRWLKTGGHVPGKHVWFAGFSAECVAVWLASDRLYIV